MRDAGRVPNGSLPAMNFTMNPVPSAARSAQDIGDLATGALLAELRVWPKPGLVSLVDSGSHADMDAGTFHASADALRPFFVALAVAGAEDAGLEDLRNIGKAAERAMLAATGGVNTHRGGIFGLGLLCAAAGALSRDESPLRAGDLGAFVRRRWGRDILCGPLPRQSHGTLAGRRYGAGGARAEAAGGFWHVYRVGLPAWKAGNRLAGGDENAAGVQACFALIAEVEDTNVLYRSGAAGLDHARQAARGFLRQGGVGQRGWSARAAEIHRDFVARGLSPGGSADLLAATLLVGALEDQPLDCRAGAPPAEGTRLPAAGEAPALQAEAQLTQASNALTRTTPGPMPLQSLSS